MGLYKLLKMEEDRRHLPPTKAESAEVLRDVWTPRPPGPTPNPRRDLFAVAPAAVPEGCFGDVSFASFPIWTAVCTNHVGYKYPVHARWIKRRGAIFLHRRMCVREMDRRRAADPHRWYPKDPLVIHYSYWDLVERLASGGQVIPGIVAPEAAKIVQHFRHGKITKEGFDALEDVEFVWPWLDGRCPEAREATELEVARRFERLYQPHYYNTDREAPPGPRVPFHQVYAGLLAEVGRAGPGTALGRWLSAWRERAEREEVRLDGGSVRTG